MTKEMKTIKTVRRGMQEETDCGKINPVREMRRPVREMRRPVSD